MKFRRYRSAAAVAAALFAFTAPLAADYDVEDIVEYRQNVMSAHGSHFGAIAAIATDAVGHDEHLVQHARALHDLTRMIGSIYPEGSGTADSRASPTIWTDREGFDAAVEVMVERSGALLSAAEAGDSAAIGEAVRAALDGCRGCHRNFRED